MENGPGTAENVGCSVIMGFSLRKGTDIDGWIQDGDSIGTEDWYPHRIMLSDDPCTVLWEEGDR